MNSSVEEKRLFAREYFRARAAESDKLAQAAHLEPLRKNFAALAERYRAMAASTTSPQQRPLRALTR